MNNNNNNNKMKLKIACVQLNPVIGSLKENTDRAYALLDKLLSAKEVSKPDLIIFPELSLTGYNFPSKEAIQPYLERSLTGHSSRFASSVSEKYQCYTLVGYPELDSHNNKIYNSVIVSSPIGKFVHNYRKCFLYETDEVWGCEEGSGFKSFNLKFGERDLKSSIGVCMDLNPYKFEAPFTKFEFATHCLQNNVELILCPMLWLKHDSPSIQDWSNSEKDAKLKSIIPYFNKIKDSFEFNLKQEGDAKQNINPAKVSSSSQDLDLTKPDASNINYWILRFFPFLNFSNYPQSNLKPSVVICNRSGLEKDVMYGGSSTILSFNERQTNTEYHDSRNDSVDVLGYMGQGVEGVLLREIEV